MHGDLEPEVFEGDEGNHYNKYDDWGNIVVTTMWSRTGRTPCAAATATIICLTMPAMIIYLLKDGAEGGVCQRDEGANVLVGGTENDHLFGSADGDVLFGEELEREKGAIPFLPLSRRIWADKYPETVDAEESGHC
jgi:hypothetical protein